MSRAVREKRLRKVWRQYLTKGKTWTRERVAFDHGVRVEDVQRLIDESGPSKVQEIMRRSTHGCYEEWHPRVYNGQLLPARKIRS